MAIKGYLIVDPECGLPCDDAIETMKSQIDAKEIEVLDPTEATRRGINIGDPEGTPVICIYSESTEKCLTHMYFHDEDGHLVLQRHPTIAEKKVKPEQA